MTERAHLVALLGLPKMGPRRLTALLDGSGSATAAWEAVVRGDLDGIELPMRADNRSTVVSGWMEVAVRTDPNALAEQHRAEDVQILGPGDAGWPETFDADPEPPRLLFVRGDPALLDRVAVAIVGTRRCSAHGSSIARELGRDLSAAGVTVVSGLALGIDGAAHRGALDAGVAPPVGVVATGLDVVYPRRHRTLWAEVADAGALVSEHPLGTGVERWRFPARNRIMAALARAVVVVESPDGGGSMRTVEAAIDRQTDVLAVPGAVRSPVAAGPNRLLAEGCGVVRDATDVLVSLGHHHPETVPPRQLTLDDPGGDDGEHDPVADAVGFPAVGLDRIVAATGLPFGQVAARLAVLEASGVVEQVADGYQRSAR